VRISFDCEMPFQIGGDGEGTRRDVVLGMSDRSLELLDFSSEGQLRRPPAA
jgi:hypothetical protein